MVRRVSLTFYTISCGEQKVEYIPWWYAHSEKVMAVALENEHRVTEQVRAISPQCEEDVFLLQFVLQNAVFRLHDPLLYAPLIVFFNDVLPQFLRGNEKTILVLEPPFDKNYSLYLLLEHIIAGRKNVTIATKRPRQYSFALRHGFPFLSTSLYAAETALGVTARLVKPRRKPKTVLLSNFRHYAATDTENGFWGNFARLLPRTNIPAPDMVYYNQILPVQRTYYAHALFDRKHTYLIEHLSATQFFSDVVSRSRPPTTFTYLYNGVDFGYILLPLVQAYYRVLYPLLRKQRNALAGLVAAKPQFVCTDSELSFMSFHLGFMKRSCALIVLSNEIITPQYAMFPYGPKRVRPSFDAKLVNGARERDILASQYHYPRNKLYVLPDPRYLDALLAPKEVRSVVLFISQSLISDAIVTLNTLLTSPKSLVSLPLLVKPHPLEDVADLQNKIGAIALYRERKLSFTPRYAVTHSSTLGLELLFQGSIVFFLSRDVFDVTRDVPYLYCRDVAEVARRVHRLERDATFMTSLRRQIQAHLTRRYTSLSLPECIKTLNTMENNLKF